jgi:hypothetical protein
VLWSACRNRVLIVTACTSGVGLNITASGKMPERCWTVPVLCVTAEKVVMSLCINHLTRSSYYIIVILLLFLCILIVCMLCSVYSVILQLPWLRFFRAFSSVVRQMPGCTSQRRGTVSTLPNEWIVSYVLFVSIVLFYVLLVCKCVLYYCHRVATQLQLNIYRIISYHIVSYISYRINSYHI